MINKLSLLRAIDGDSWDEKYVPPDNVLEGVLATLDPREKLVLFYRFNDKPMTLREVGLIFPRRQPASDGSMVGVTGERVREIEAKALRKLRHPSRSYVLRGGKPLSSLYDYIKVQEMP